jgi:hypothetical protein
MPEEKTYVPRSGAKEISKNGWSMLKLSFKSADFVKFIHENTNEKGYINLCVTKRREVGQYGDTHCVWLDTWRPSENRSPQAVSPQPAADTATPIEDDDVPF